jgi:hypothetical protein
VRGGRVMPARADIDPGEIPRLLPYIIMHTVAADYTIHLVGEEIVRFTGHNATGHPVASTMSPRSAEMMIKILDAVTTEHFARARRIGNRAKTITTSKRVFCRYQPMVKRSTSSSAGSALPTLAEI